MNTTPTAAQVAAPRASDDAYLTPAEVSDLLAVPAKTLGAWRTKRTGPLFYRIGVHVRYPKVHLDAWLAERLAEAQNWMQA